jgi:electron transport complex protein RnfG
VGGPIRLGAILMIMCMVAAGLLAFTNAKTEPIIAANEQKQLEQALKELLPEAETFEPDEGEDKSFYLGRQGDTDVGVVAVFSQKGFGGLMKLALGVDMEGEVTGFKILQHAETPGLGARIADQEFVCQFVGKKTNDAFILGEDIEGISGATISSESVTDCIKLLADEIQTKYNLG